MFTRKVVLKIIRRLELNPGGVVGEKIPKEYNHLYQLGQTSPSLSQAGRYRIFTSLRQNPER